MPSSVIFGSRPRICLTRAYSSAVRPCSAATSGVTLISVGALAIPSCLDHKGHDRACPCTEIGIFDHYQAVALAAPTSASIIERKITRPSAESRADSTARSGWGIRPATLRSRLQMPAMLVIGPLGFPAASLEPSGVV